MGFSLHGVNYDKEIVYIIDDEIGMSITNDAENVVMKINNSFPNYRIVYRDTAGTWDELVHENGVFKGFKFLDNFTMPL